MLVSLNCGAWFCPIARRVSGKGGSPAGNPLKLTRLAIRRFLQIAVVRMATEEGNWPRGLLLVPSPWLLPASFPSLTIEGSWFRVNISNM